MRNIRIRPFLLLSILSLVMLTACVGPPKSDKCIPSDGTMATDQNGRQVDTNSPPQTGSTAQQIDDALRNGKIISTVVSKIKEKVLGSSSGGGGGAAGGGGTGSSAGGGYTSSQGIFEGFVNSDEYQTAISAAFMLYLILYGLGVATGIVQATLSEGAIRVAKIAFIAAMAMNWDTFYQTIGSFFVDGTDELIKYFMQNFESLYNPGGAGASSGGSSGADAGGDATSSIFAAYDIFIARIFSFQTMAFISALFNAGQYAPIYGAMLMLSLWYILQAILKVVQVYVFSLFAKALLFAIAPIFLAFLLFQQTKPMFDAWLRQLVSFSLQPILITAYIGLFSSLMQPFFEEFAQYKMCWNKVNNTTNKYGWTFVDKGSKDNQPIDPSINSPVVVSLQSILLFMFFSWLFITALKMTDAIVIAIANSGHSSMSSINALRDLSKSATGTGNLKGLLKKGV